MSYNMLCSALSEQHINCTRVNTLAANRWGRIESNLLREWTTQRKILCLQEVSLEWASKLTVNLHQQGYEFMFVPYGASFNGFMGVALAVPRDKFSLVDCELAPIVNLKPMEKTPGFWTDIARRRNAIVSAKLKCTETHTEFVVSTTHLPCVFSNPSVLNTYATIAMQNVQKFAKATPFVFAGDFNFTPDSDAYALYTLGKDLPTEGIPAHIDFTPKVDSTVESAYFTFNGEEPQLTNCGSFGTNPVFTGTLDYLFHSTGVKVLETSPLPSAAEVTAPLPDANHPSDHIPIGASFEFTE